MTAVDPLRATLANHRSIFRRNALAAGGRVERFGAVQLTYTGRAGAIMFPRSPGELDPVIESASVRPARGWLLGAAARSRARRVRGVARLPMGLAATLDVTRPRPVHR